MTLPVWHVCCSICLRAAWRHCLEAELQMIFTFVFVHEAETGFWVRLSPEVFNSNHYNRLYNRTLLTPACRRSSGWSGCHKTQSSRVDSGRRSSAACHLSLPCLLCLLLIKVSMPQKKKNSTDATCNTQQVSGWVVMTGRTFTLDYLNMIKWRVCCRRTDPACRYRHRRGAATVLLTSCLLV